MSQLNVHVIGGGMFRKQNRQDKLTKLGLRCFLTKVHRRLWWPERKNSSGPLKAHPSASGRYKVHVAWLNLHFGVWCTCVLCTRTSSASPSAWGTMTIFHASHQRKKSHSQPTLSGLSLGCSSTCSETLSTPSAQWSAWSNSRGSPRPWSAHQDFSAGYGQDRKAMFQACGPEISDVPKLMKHQSHC